MTHTAPRNPTGETTMTAITINIITRPKFSLTRTAWPVFLMAGTIGVGVAVGSVAMQWAGFFLGFLLTAGVITMLARKDSDLTLDEAEAYIADLRKIEAKP